MGSRGEGGREMREKGTHTHTHRKREGERRGRG